MKRKKESSQYSISGLSEFSALSKIVIGVMIIATLFSLALYIWMAIPPGKVYRLDDQAGVFSEQESDELLTLMKTIKRENDINVMVVTVQDKGLEYQRQVESESIRYAQDRFKELSRFETLRDNSGVLILLELDGDYRFFYIVTFGTAKASITNSECDTIFQSQLSLLTSGNYQQAVQKSLVEISKHNFTSGLLILTYATFIIAPFLIIIPIIRLLTRRKRSLITVDATTYLDPDVPNMIQKTDVCNSENSYIDEDSGEWTVLSFIFRILLYFFGVGDGGRDDDDDSGDRGSHFGGGGGGSHFSGGRGGGGGHFGGGGGGGRGGGGGGRFGGGGGRF